MNSLAELCQEMDRDKHATGAESSLRDRYPLRFVLLENFSDFACFVEECSTRHIIVQSIDKLMDRVEEDQMLSYSQLANKFMEYVKHIPVNDFTIAPFSEIARFYDNDRYTEFDALVKTIRLIEASEEAQQTHQRIYVPIIGMQGKMNRFRDDANIHIWECHTGDDAASYRLVLTNGTTYGVGRLDEVGTVCDNFTQWISLWKTETDKKVKPTIICSSKAIYANARHAQPDNAFSYCVCGDAFSFLHSGLGLDFGNLQPAADDNPYWEQLAGEVDATDFEFEAFVADHFNRQALSDERDFVQAWFDRDDDFDRWLLRTYYLYKDKGQGYLADVLARCGQPGTSELFSLIATLIFDETAPASALAVRANLMEEASHHGVKITDMAERKLKAKLEAIATNPERGYYTAMKYVTALTRAEQLLMIDWVGKKKIARDDIRKVFPSLYHYLAPHRLQFAPEKAWVNDYFDEYRKSKMANEPTDGLRALLEEKNASPQSFALWRDGFKTVKTILHDREDIDVFYWIDGLGLDWVPFVMNVIERNEADHVWVNEVFVATAELPTRTANNKERLKELAGDRLMKIGDLDSFAHKQKKWPDYIADELAMVEKAIGDVLASYNGKKVAFVADHGLSYMAGRETGLNLAGVKADHWGRCGEWETSGSHTNCGVVETEDGKAICALTHRSLTTKTPAGQGAHGGATPEEVLVPVIIVSGHRNAHNYSASLNDFELVAASPVCHYTIKGLSNVDIPMVKYNGVEYALKKTGVNQYESERLNLVETSRQLTLVIGNFEQTDVVTVKTGAHEEDLFGDL